MIEFGVGGTHRFAWLGLIALAAISSPTAARAQAAPGDALQVPAKSVPVPGTVSPQLAKIVGMPLRNGWDVLPKTGEEWVPVVQATAAATLKNIPGLQERLHVKVEKTTIDGVRAFVVTPETIPPQNQGRVLLHMHGGCLRPQSRRGRAARGAVHGRLWWFQGHLGRLSHAAGGILSGRAR